jgi:hypothetical protein
MCVLVCAVMCLCAFVYFNEPPVEYQLQQAVRVKSRVLVKSRSGINAYV